MKICAYCSLEECKCGARDYIDKPPKDNWQKSEPFAYMGYVVWPLRNYFSDITMIRFYRGIELIGDIEITHDELRLAGIKECEDQMPYIFEKFEREFPSAK